MLITDFGNNSIDGSLRTDNSVWNAGLKIAGMIDDKEIDVTDKTVLDIGAGTGVAGILSILDRAGNVFDQRSAASSFNPLDRSLGLRRNLPSREFATQSRHSITSRAAWKRNRRRPYLGGGCD